MRFLIVSVTLLLSLSVVVAAEPLIDTHNHLQGGRHFDFTGAAATALSTMDASGVQTCLLMPPPQSPGQKGAYRVERLMKDVESPRFRFLGGGGSLNIMIQAAVKRGVVSDALRRDFRARARRLVELGVVGFGEMSAEHFSLNSTHPYVSAPPDHELFLELADIAADTGLPIDLHMEMITAPLSLPSAYASPPNPSRLTPNLAAFERLLAHNRKTKIVWVHCGWDNTGQRTPELTRKLLSSHPNLFISLRRFVRRPKEKSVAASDLVDDKGRFREGWRQLILDFPQRFVLGSDEFYLSPQVRRPFHPSTGSTKLTADLLAALPPKTATLVGYTNARRVYGL